MSLPIPNLDNKTFDQLVAEARALIPRAGRDWTDHNLSDPGMTFIDLFAWLAEMQIYGLNRVRDQHYLKFLRLLNLHPQPAKPARAFVTFEPAPANSSVLLEKGTRVAARDLETGHDIVFETDEALHAVALELEAIITQNQSGVILNTGANAQDGMFYFAFGENPRAGDAWYLGFKSNFAFPAVGIKLRINLYQDDLPARPVLKDDEFEIFPPAQLLWEYFSTSNQWKRLGVNTDTTRALTQSGSVAFSGPSDAARHSLFNLESELYWIRCRVVEAEYTIPPRIDSLLLNTVLATHGQTWRDEILDASNGLPGQAFTLAHTPVIAGTEILLVREGEGETSWQKWSSVPDFDSSGPEDSHYLLKPATGEIHFGDGTRGRIPPTGMNNLKAEIYRSGGGAIGNVKAGDLNRILTPSFSQLKVKNHTPAQGGEEAESLAAAQARARNDLRTITRAVTSADYETLALATPGILVARAKALPGYNPNFPCSKIPGAVSVVVIPHVLPESADPNPVPGKSFLRTVQQYLQKFRLLTASIFVIPPVYIKVSVKTVVKVKPRTDAARIKAEIQRTLKRFLDPVTGGPEGTGWPFGYEVIASEVYQVIQNVSGVDYVERLDLTAADENVKTICGNLSIPANAVVYSGEHEVASGY